MKYSFIRQLLQQSTWFIEPQTANANAAIYNGIMQGLVMADETANNSSFLNHKTTKGIPQGKSIHVLQLKGVMLREDGDCGYEGTRTLANYLAKADANPEVIGHILSIDSGGGASNSVPVLADAIRKCTKPVVAHVDGMMASAAMYVGSYTDYIIANHIHDRIGCIGTMIEIEGYPNQHKSPDGRITLRIYADQSTEKNEEYETALSGDFKLIKENLLNPVNAQFVADIKANRPSVTESQLHGRTFFAKDVQGSLIDQVGSFEDAVNKVISLSNIKINQMEKVPHLNMIASCAGLVSVDGYVTLSDAQVADIEQALALNDQINPLTDKVKKSTTEIENLNANLTKRTEELQEAQSRITELEEALAATKHNPVAMPGHNGTHAPQSPHESSDQEAFDIAMNFINNH